MSRVRRQRSESACECYGDFSPINPRMVSIISMAVPWKRVVKMVLRLACVGLFLFALLLAIGLWYSTAHGYMTWWFSSRSQVFVDGVRSGFARQLGALRSNNNANRFTSEPIVLGRTVRREILDSLRRLGSTTTPGVFNRRREPTLFVLQQRLGFASGR